MVISGLTLRVHVLVEDFQFSLMLGCLFRGRTWIVLWSCGSLGCGWLLKSVLPVSLLGGQRSSACRAEPGVPKGADGVLLQAASPSPLCWGRGH